MKLLVDTDAFCKLALAGLLQEAVGLLGADIRECARLPALPYMLRRGKLRSVYGPDACDGLIPLAIDMPTAEPPGDVWLDKLSPLPAIDAGEALIFATAAEKGIHVLTGDKRALRALKDVEGFADALAERIAVMEAVLYALCDQLGPDEVRQRVAPIVPTDTMVQVCFSPGNQDARAALLSYYHDLANALDPLRVWRPPTMDVS